MGRGRVTALKRRHGRGSWGGGKRWPVHGAGRWPARAAEHDAGARDGAEAPTRSGGQHAGQSMMRGRVTVLQRRRGAETSTQGVS